MENYQIIIVIAIIAFIVEIFTIGFIAGAIGIGLLFAAFGNYLELELKWQILLFALGIMLTYFLIRPIILKFGHRDKVKTNQEALLDKSGIVTEEINISAGTGRVSIDGDDWKAISLDDEIITIGERVRIINVKSIILTVKKE